MSVLYSDRARKVLIVTLRPFAGLRNSNALHTVDSLTMCQPDTPSPPTTPATTRRLRITCGIALVWIRWLSLLRLNGLRRSASLTPGMDPNRKIYFVKVYHQLHCLKNIRRAFKKLLSPETDPISFGHVEHCLDTLRQDLMCRADDTPMPSLQLVNGAGEAQIRQCRNFEALVAWTKHPDRDACYRRLSDYRPPSRSIDRYAFCAPGSEHFPTMTRYFEYYGWPQVVED
ncbi:uncharacterized protein BO72DRAFT_59140 [Aspergillus fijiensis CBS 313.89]|uniref:Uncharacterized protein n=1 Tax=Aspergillus fijiensis CBS 313.89 TaxID=1448319 RepID=A0A8G1RW33_9EURO|nr:uncharacterized protein BO72DRAFT_59140 [Aspergillus fijiensis CBS 313.89]RAK78865.1 hypothetical protein BO72DRAFT_59140 [Aspergillus fijiensis CBS 313.89]